MCGRYANHLDRLQGWEDIFVDWPEDVPVGFNVSPTQVVPVFTGAGGAGMRWGLIPNWSREASGKYSTFNARIESVESKPAFRHAWSVSQHCLIPAVGYYEWRAEQGAKQPYFVRPADSSPLVFAGLYEPARDDAVPASCTIITRPATPDMAGLHPRMPVLLTRERAEQWLNGPAENSKEIALSEELPRLTVYPVGREVNNPRNQGPQLLHRLGDVNENDS